MREILFRGKRIDDGEWVEGAYFPQNDTYPTTIFERHSAGYFVRSETVGQYTGLKDKNSKPIFEGDILQFSYIGENKGVKGKESVVFKNGKFGVEWGWHRDFTCLDGFANTYIEVIGNIHDNPEMLEVR